MTNHEADAILRRLNARLDTMREFERRAVNLTPSELAEANILRIQAQADLAEMEAAVSAGRLIERAREAA